MSFKERKEIPLKHLFDGNELNVYDTGVINLSAGTPSEALLRDCCEIFNEATRHRMNYEIEENQSFLFQYGPTVGSFQFRKNLSEFLTKGYQAKVYAEDLVLTAGATNGLHLILSTLVNMSDGYVFLDEVTYMIALEAISQFSTLKVVPVKLNKNGVDIFDLEEKIKKYRNDAKDKMFWGIYYTIPCFHNPTSIVFSPEINEILIRLSRQYEVLIVCDDVYNLLAFDAKPPKRLFTYDRFDDDDFQGNVISNGTFSKLLAPGIRVGWMECPPRIVEAFRNSGVLKSGGAINNYASGIISSMIEMGLVEKQYRKSLETYRTQCASLCETLDLFLPSSCKFDKPDGGYFVWIELPEGCDGDSLSEYCLSNFHVFAIRGSRFSVENKFKNFIRLTFAFHSSPLLREGGKRLCEGIKSFLAKNNIN